MANGSMAPSRFDLALFIFRIALALPFLYHGSAILLGAFGGPGFRSFAGFMHAPVAVGFLVGFAQFAGGLAMLTGAFVRLGAVCILIVMAGAIFLVHLPHGYSVATNGAEYALSLALVALGMLITGPGSYSLAGIFPPALRNL